MSDNNQGENQDQIEKLDIDSSDEDSLVGTSPGQSGSTSEDMGEEVGLKKLEDERGNPEPLGSEPVAEDGTDETEAEE